MIRIDILDAQSMFTVDRKLIRSWARQSLKALGTTDAELSVVFTDNGEIQKLNHQYLGKDRPTNVISFPQNEGIGPGGSHIGDIVISLEQAALEARDAGMSHSERIMQLLVHGICHLMGYDHEGVSPDAAGEMEVEEERIRGLLSVSAQSRGKGGQFT